MGGKHGSNWTTSREEFRKTSAIKDTLLRKEEKMIQLEEKSDSKYSRVTQQIILVLNLPVDESLEIIR